MVFISGLGERFWLFFFVKKYLFIFGLFLGFLGVFKSLGKCLWFEDNTRFLNCLKIAWRFGVC